MLKMVKRYPMIISAVLGALVIATFYYFSYLSLILTLLIIVLLFVLWIKRTPSQLLFSLFCVICIALSMLVTLKSLSVKNSYNNSRVTGEFAVIEEPVKYSDNYYGATLKATATSLLKRGEKLMVTIGNNRCEELKLGDIITIDACAESMEKRANRLSFYSVGVFLETNIYDYEKIDSRDAVFSFIGSVRGYISGYLFKYLPKDVAATLCALTFGERSYMSDYFYGCVKASGVMHVMVVSGMHLSIIMVFLNKLIEKFFYNRYVKAVITALTVAFMVVLCGFSASILRAGITYMFMALSYIFKRPNTSSNNLGSAVTAIFIASPLMLFSVAFQLSVLSTFAVLQIAPMFKGGLKIKNKLLDFVVESISVSIAAMLLTLPVVIYRFGYLSVVGVITNLLISAAVTAALVSAAAALVINLVFPFAAHFFLIFAGVVTKYINAVIITLGSWEFSTVDVPVQMFWIGILIILLLLILLAACKYRSDMLKLRKMENKVLSETVGEGKWQ